ncbi:cytochrome c biogenesis protein ResB [uncultured Porphyromonas sp.]|uniref:cytochrome c biogenesis protein ResB n=1 Tax=uncultured Porphyromonas sp. TaxID=159274 RepID=UPI0025E23F6D|nr:cytochrome c biogenesis protein ResB [uncultured Porphyromonas sp.]
MSKGKSLWSGRWGYREGWVITGGLLLIALLWQGILGPLPGGMIPHSTVIGAVIILILTAGICTGLRERRVVPEAIRYLFSPAATICSITLFMGVTLVAGLTTQVPPEMAIGMGGVLHHMGATSVVHSYPFVTSYLYLLLVLLCVTMRRVWHFRRPIRDGAFVLNHLGLAYFLTFALLSSSAIERYRMTITEGDTEWRGLIDGRQEPVELPIAIELKDFRMEEYPPKLMLLDGTEGLVKGKGGTPLELLLDQPLPQSGLLGQWHVTVDEQLPLAAPVMSGDTLRYVEWGSDGATMAAHVIVSREGDEPVSGWVSNGSYLIPYRALTLKDSLTLVMPECEPKQYYSDVVYYTREGSSGQATISVNSPLRLGDWYIYQLSYDERKGRWSDLTQLELVRDPYMPHIYIGLVMLLLGAILLIFSPPTDK